MTLPTEPAVVEVPDVVGEPRLSGGYLRYARSLSISALSTLLFILVFNFFLFRVMPGDPAAKYKGARNVDQESIKNLMASFNKPLPQQFLDYLKNPLGLGQPSFTKSKPVWDVIGDQLWPTVVLVGSATIISVIFGVIVGIKSGWKRGSRFDKGATGVTLTLWGTPEFWLGMIFLMFFAGGISGLPEIFPPGLFQSPDSPGGLAGILNIAWHMVLPVTALSLVYIAEYSLIIRSSIIDESQQDYLTTGRAFGLRDKQVRTRHAVPNASLPTITLVLLNVGFIIGGAVTIEYTFSLPGLGSLYVDAIQGQDYILLQAMTLLFTVSVLVAVTVADLVIAWVDPRIRI